MTPEQELRSVLRDELKEVRQDIKEIREEMTTLKIKVATIGASVGSIVTMIIKALAGEFK